MRGKKNSKHHSYLQRQQFYFSARYIHKEQFDCTSLLVPDAQASAEGTYHYLHALVTNSTIRDLEMKLHSTSFQ